MQQKLLFQRYFQIKLDQAINMTKNLRCTNT